jgi:hypothetical protein
VSRADLARRMNVGRGMVTSLVDELLGEGAIYEGGTVDAPRGRRPQMLFVRTRDRLVVGVDVRFSRTAVMLADFAGHSSPRRRSRRWSSPTRSSPRSPRACAASSTRTRRAAARGSASSSPA